MIFKFIRRHFTGTINRVEGERGQFSGDNSSYTIITNKTFDEKRLLNSSWCLTVPSVTFILYNNPTLNNCFHIYQQVNQLIINQMENYLN